MGTAQSSPKHERPAGAFFSCPCLRAGCSALRGLCRPCWLPLWRLRLPLRRGQARRERGGGARARRPVCRHRHRLQELLWPRRPLPAGRDPLTRKRLPLPPLPPSCPTDSALATTVLATPDLDTMDSATPMPWLPPPLSRLRSPSPSTSTCLR